MTSTGGLKEKTVVAAGMLPSSKEDEEAAVRGLPELWELVELFIVGLAKERLYVCLLWRSELECAYVDICSLKQNIFLKQIHSISFPQSVAFSQTARGQI